MHVTAVRFPRRYRVVSLAVAAVVAMSGCAAAGHGPSGNAPDAPEISASPVVPAADTAAAGRNTLPADSVFQRFIVKYRADTAPGRDVAAARERVATMQAQSGIALEWLRRLGVEADVIKAGRPLDRAEASALMERFSADPEVEYIEVDGVMTIRKGVDVPPVKPLR